MKLNATTIENVKGLLLATLICFSMIYAQVAHARLLVGPSVGSSVRAASMVNGEMRLPSGEGASVSDDVISAGHPVSSAAVGQDHGGGLQNDKLPVHSSTVFGTVESGDIAHFDYGATKLKVLLLDQSIDGRPVPVDHRPPKI